MGGGLQDCPRCGREFPVLIDQGMAWGRCGCGYSVGSSKPVCEDTPRAEDRGETVWRDVRVVIIGIEPYQTGEGFRSFPIAGGSTGAEALRKLGDYRPQRMSIEVDGIGEGGRFSLFKGSSFQGHDAKALRHSLAVADRWAERARRSAE